MLLGYLTSFHSLVLPQIGLLKYFDPTHTGVGHIRVEASGRGSGSPESQRSGGWALQVGKPARLCVAQAAVSEPPGERPFWGLGRLN